MCLIPKSILALRDILRDRDFPTRRAVPGDQPLPDPARRMAPLLRRLQISNQNRRCTRCRFASSRIDNPPRRRSLRSCSTTSTHDLAEFPTPCQRHNRGDRNHTGANTCPTTPGQTGARSGDVDNRPPGCGDLAVVCESDLHPAGLITRATRCLRRYEITHNLSAITSISTARLVGLASALSHLQLWNPSVN